MKSLSFPSAVEVLLSNLTDLQNQIPWGVLVLVLVLCLDPQAGKPDVGFRAFPTQGELLCIIVFQFVGCPLGGYGILFYCDCTPHTMSLRLLLCLWTWDIFFLAVSGVLLSTVVKQLQFWCSRR